MLIIPFLVVNTIFVFSYYYYIFIVIYVQKHALIVDSLCNLLDHKMTYTEFEK